MSGSTNANLTSACPNTRLFGFTRKRQDKTSNKRDGKITPKREEISEGKQELFQREILKTTQISYMNGLDATLSRSDTLTRTTFPINLDLRICIRKKKAYFLLLLQSGRKSKSNIRRVTAYLLNLLLTLALCPHLEIWFHRRKRFHANFRGARTSPDEKDD